MTSGTTDRFSLDRTDWLSIAAIVAVAVIARGIFILVLPPLLHLDSDSYFEIAARLWQGDGFGDLSRRTPLYPLFLWLAGRFESAGLLPVVILQHLLGAATVVLLYLLARRLLPERMRAVAAASGLVLAVIPYPILIEHSILSESLFTFLLAAAAYSLLAWWEEDRARSAVSCGALLGLAALTRPVAVEIFPLWTGILFLREMRKGRTIERKRAAGFLLRAGLAWAVLLLPLLIRNYAVMGSFSLERSLGRNLISVADRWISYGVVNESGAYPEVKAVYAKYLQQKRGPDAVVVYAAMPELRRATGWTDAEIDRALAGIAWEAIREHPRAYVATRLYRLRLLFRDPAPSAWYALQAETYLPFLARTGRINPELVSRSLAWPGLSSTRFELAERAYQALSINALSLDLTRGLRFLFPLLGFAGIVFIEKRKSAWLLAGVLAYLWLGTIFLQPPNARYRIPGIPWEVLFAVAGCWYAVRVAAWLFRKLPRKLTDRPAKEISDAAVLRLALGTLAVILGSRIWAVSGSQPIFRTADFMPTAAFSSQLLRELPVAGRPVTVLYWEGSAMERGETVSAEAGVDGGGTYATKMFYSCEEATCAGGRIELSALDGEGRILAQASRPLSQERIDNDLFWDQAEFGIAAPSGTHRLRVELLLQAGAGNVVIPWIELRRVSKLPF